MKKLASTRKVVGSIDATYSGSTKTAPAETAGSGTITTVGINFTLSVAHDVVPGDWIFNGTTEVRKVQSMDPSGLFGKLSSAFSIDLTGASVSKVTAKVLDNVFAIDIDVTGTNVTVNGISYAQNRTRRYALPTTMEAGIDLQLKPLVIYTAGAGGSCNVFVNCYEPTT